MAKIIFITLFTSCILVFLHPQIALAQKKKGGIGGTVQTVDNQPAENITIGLKGLNRWAVSDKMGRFHLNADAGSYTLVVYSIFCHQQQIPVTVKAGEITALPVITIIENKAQLGEVVVTGQYKPQSLQKSVYKIKVIGPKQIESKGATTIQALLNTEAGIRISNDMALGESDFELMGMSGNNIKVLIDGVPMIDRLDKKQSLSQIDINTIERVEIVEGPMSVIYGSDALAGVINIITKKGGAEEGKPWTISGRIQEESVGKEYSFAKGDGSHNQNIAAGYSGRSGWFGQGSFTHNDYGGWQGSLTGRAKQWQPKDQYIAGTQLGFKNDRFGAWYRLDYLNENILTMADVNLLTKTTSDKEFLVDRFTHQLQSEWKVSSKVSLSASGSFQQYERKTRTTDINLATGRRTLSLASGAQDNTSFDMAFGRITGVWNALTNLSIQPGVEYQSTSGTGDRISGRKDINNTALYVTAEYTPWEWLNIRPGLRSNFNSVFEAPKAVPSLNTKVMLGDKTDLRLSYGRGYRAPTLQELFYSFHDSNHNIDGNPNLRAEHSNSYMASLVVRPLHNQDIRLTSSLSGFFNDFRNRITLTQSAVKPGYYIYQNIDKYKTTGLTLENSLSTANLSANVALTIVGRYNKYYNVDTYANESTSMFRFSPELSASVSYNVEKVALFSLFYKFTGSRREYMIDSNNKLSLIGLDSYHWADITISRKVFKFLSLDLGVRNLFDITEVKSNGVGSSSGHGSSTGASHLGNGRSYFTALRYNF